jgi:hypothetical protein
MSLEVVYSTSHLIRYGFRGGGPILPRSAKGSLGSFAIEFSICAKKKKDPQRVQGFSFVKCHPSSDFQV